MSLSKAAFFGGVLSVSAIAACTLLTDVNGLSGATATAPDGSPDARSTTTTDAAAAADTGTTTGDANTEESGGASGITLVATRTGKMEASASLVVTLSEPPHSGDLLLAVVYDSQAEAGTPSVASAPTGWMTQSQKGYWWTFYAVAQAGAVETTVTFKFTASENGLPNSAAAVAVYRGVDAKAPIDAFTSVQCFDGSSAECNAPSIITTRSDETLILLYGLDGASDAPAWMPPVAMTKRADVGSVAFADGLQAVAGPTGVMTSTHTVTGWSSYVSFLTLARAH